MALHSAKLCLTPVLAFVLFAAASARGEGGEWSLTTADLRTTPATLVGIAPDGIHVMVNSAARTVPMEQFVELARTLPPAAPSGRFSLYLVGGDHVTGEPVGIKGEQLVWKNVVTGETSIPLRLIAGMAKSDAGAPAAQQREDVVALSNGDVARGTISDISNTTVKLQSDSGAGTIFRLASVKSISLASSAASGRDRAGTLIRLDDGSILLGSAVTMDRVGLQLSLPNADGQIAACPVDLGHVTSIEQFNGPICWLSSRAPSQNVYVPYYGSNLGYAARMNLNCDGQPLRFREKNYLRGIGAHAYSKVVFPLDGKTYHFFRTQFAVDESVRDGSADVTVRVLLDDKIAFDKTHVRPGQLAPPVVLQLNGARNPTLEVDYGDHLGAQGRLDWLEPALLKVAPAAP